MEMVSPPPDPDEVNNSSMADTIKTIDQTNFTAQNNKPEPQYERETTLSRNQEKTFFEKGEHV